MGSRGGHNIVTQFSLRLYSRQLQLSVCQRTAPAHTLVRPHNLINFPPVQHATLLYLPIWREAGYVCGQHFAEAQDQRLPRLLADGVVCGLDLHLHGLLSC